MFKTIIKCNEYRQRSHDKPKFKEKEVETQRKKMNFNSSFIYSASFGEI